MSGQDQRIAFGPTPKGQRKIILATNVAETSLTIADVTFVVDTGKHKQMQFDPYSKISSLVQVIPPAAAAPSCPVSCHPLLHPHTLSAGPNISSQRQAAAWSCRSYQTRCAGCCCCCC